MATIPFRIIVVVGLMALTTVGVHSAVAFNHSQRRHPDWSKIKYQIGPWQGREEQFDPVYGSDPATTSTLRIYKHDQQPPVILYVGFHADITSILDLHTPAICYPAQGWRIMSQGQDPAGAFRGAQIDGSEIVVDKDGSRRLVMWWYTAGDKTFQYRMRYVYRMLLTSLVTGRTDGSIVRIETPTIKGDDAAAKSRVLEFSHLLLPQLESAIPK